jgi:periplasmic divalent cation tolerance protein
MPLPDGHRETDASGCRRICIEAIPKPQQEEVTVTNINFVYMTVGNMDEARKIGSRLVTSKLAACVNMIENMASVYIWDGEIQEDREIVLIAKTTQDRVPDLIEAVKAQHSYDCPCIVTIPVTGGNEAFLGWIENQVR